MIFVLVFIAVSAQANVRPRARDIGLVVGIFPTGDLIAITDVGGVWSTLSHFKSGSGDCPASASGVKDAIIAVAYA